MNNCHKTARPVPTETQSSPRKNIKDISTCHFREVFEHPPVVFTIPLRLPYRGDVMLNSSFDLSFASVRSIIDRKSFRECLMHISI